MKLLTSFFLVTFLSFAAFSDVFSASLKVDAPDKASQTSDPVVITVSLDPEDDSVSGVAGDLSYPTDQFIFYLVSTQGSVVSPWVEYPKISTENYLDGRTHVTFEGIFAGGFSGVRSAYYNGEKDGKLFTLVLIPKKKGAASVILSDITINRFDEKATRIPTTSVIKEIVVPDLISNAILPVKQLKLINPTSLNVLVTRDNLVLNNAWYVLVTDREPRSSIESISLSESDQVVIESVPEYAWRTISGPYVLFHQDLSKYIHVKVFYSDGTYATRTIAPVENSQISFIISRILMILAILASTYVLYIYIKHHCRFSKRTSKSG